MKHIIEKHVQTIAIPAAPTHVVINKKAIPAKDFPALISDLEAEMCKFVEWVLGYVHPSTTQGIYYLTDDPFCERPKTTAELLKIYQNQEK